MQNKTPKTKCAMANSMPPKIIHIILNIRLKQPIGREGNCGSRPKGSMANRPIFISWYPKGMPTTVRQNKTPITIYANPRTNPPRISQRILPNNDITNKNLVINDT